MRLSKFPFTFFLIDQFLSQVKPGATNLSGTNLNVGVYDNGPKGRGQDARSHLRQFRFISRTDSASLYTALDSGVAVVSGTEPLGSAVIVVARLKAGFRRRWLWD